MSIASANPRAVIVAGPNGSGKSTLIRQLRSDPEIDFPERYINADDIAAHLREVSPDTPQIDREGDAFRRARGLRLQYREEGVSHAFETVFSHPSTLVDMLELRSAGFEVVLHFVTTRQPEINIARVSLRIQQGGHDVPVDRIRDRYYRAMTFLPLAAEIADEAYVFDSSETRKHGTLLVAEVRRGEAIRSEDVPEYLVRALSTALLQRREERSQLGASLSSYEAITSPDLRSGTYTGPIRTALTDYVLQQTGPATFVRHDALLLTAPVAAGDNVTITYKDGYGSIQPL